MDRGSLPDTDTADLPPKGTADGYSPRPKAGLIAITVGDDTTGVATRSRNASLIAHDH